MELSHSFTVPAPVEQTWELLLDLEQVGGCFPGATVTEASPEGFSGTVKVKLGPIAMLYSGSGEFVDRDDAAHRAVIAAKGKDKRGNGTAGATVTLALTPDGQGTRADVATDLQVTGKPAQFGRGVMQDVSDKLLGQFIACIEGKLSAGEGPSAEGVSPEAGPAEAPGAAPVDALPADAAPAAPPGSNPVADAPAQRAPLPHPTPAAYRPDDDAIDLGSAVLPVLVRRYAVPAGAALVGLLVGLALGRRRSGSA